MFQKFTTDRCYIIAEIGGNFTRFDEAQALIDAAANTGVDAVKLQTYRADTIASRKAMFDMENTGLVSQHELFKKYEIDLDLHKAVFDYAEDGLPTDYATLHTASATVSAVRRFAIFILRLPFSVPEEQCLDRRFEQVGEFVDDARALLDRHIAPFAALERGVARAHGAVDIGFRRCRETADHRARCRVHDVHRAAAFGAGPFAIDQKLGFEVLLVDCIHCDFLAVFRCGFRFREFWLTVT